MRGAHDMRREHRVLAALDATPVPVPDVVAFCEDDGVVGAPFYIMREVGGAVVRGAAEAAKLTIEQRAALSDGLLDALRDLHEVDVDGVGLGDFGKRGGYAARQVRTWGKQWQSSKTRELPDRTAYWPGWRSTSRSTTKHQLCTATTDSTTLWSANSARSSTGNLMGA
ncbi:MAG: hypothetical protein QOH56_3705 [Pseudonocardiales bacterium]|nr:hypothetical protein [Pseudonocardiales bacterium]